MNKDDFLRKLESLLSDLPVEERREAMEYYVEYFEEAGQDKEKDVVKELGSPEEVAHNIHKELAEKGLITMPQQPKKKQTNGWQIACIVLICIVISPVAIPLIITAVALAFAMVFTVISVMIAAVITVVAIVCACLAAAILLFIIGVSNILIAPFVAMMLIGMALIAAAVFLLMVFLTVKLCSVVLPAMFKGLIHLVGLPFRKKEVA